MKLVRDIELPASKSESNRALMIAACGGFAPDFQNLSDANDTSILAEALREIQLRHPVIDIADCGTAARFLTTFLACHTGEWLLTGTDRMKQRPMQPLVDALVSLGADIQYVEKQGFLPLFINGQPISGGKVRIDMSQSSQFVSSLLMAAPTWPQGLEHELLGNPNSIPYLDMTLAMMRHFSACVERNGNLIKVFPKPYQSANFTVSPDWSAASYWYEMAALSEDCEIKLRSLSLSKGRPISTGSQSTIEGSKSRHFLQGDSIVAEWMKALGVCTFEESDALVLRKYAIERQPVSFDLSDTPDLFPTMAATCAGLQIEARFMGIANLHLKESDRVEAMKTELAKIGAELRVLNENEVLLKPVTTLPFFELSHPLRFASHNDHRIVMALAPLALKVGSVAFDHPEVVRKSYPTFWSDTRFLLI